ncbi:TPA: tyrosine transporter [Mannheimia haemolytica]|uniref:Aromatic amino acid permease n=2 Tax=Mannheimia haemolytica TaxID=75985 RepID=A0A547EDI8_MANHA|nr:aromatic amino acid transport family protein [Mannheimia haemolytica]AWW72252.1 tyrosine transporter [Pasteurellaceae bacterium 12565]AGI33549.1 tyrosine transporter [Mannheimia haemolytica USDA-ARS-USMARC-183]AGI34537.1 tyrosine transporter [Mannheimia haemolytica USDA-ARS-USMARC-185]AGK01535.1 tyrosine/H(+) symporter TyrP [Mannheimia haemolytica M42548]AJE08939.1 tyrosine transporter [Mannheimia haemolytica USDA-ARS-USMARC-184]
MKNKILGSALMIAGTTIGAGMLAMPLTSAGMGFGATALLLVGLWALLAYTGLLFMEVYQTAPQKDVGVASLAEQYFGLIGRVLATFSLLVLLYALLAAYITGGGSLLAGVMPEMADADMKLKISILIFTAVLGTFVVVGVKSVDGLTRVLFLGKIVAFIAVLLMMLPKAKLENLTAIPLDNLLIISAIPIFFTAFGFHVIMGTINSYLDADIGKIRKSIYIGTAIPLVAYLLWQLATHGVLSQNEFTTILTQDPTLNGLVKATSQITGSTILGEMVRLFSVLALITSFLGVSMGIFEGVGDLLKRLNLPTNRLWLTIATFTPPILFALFYPNGFIKALGYAGLLFAFYGMILPIGLAWKARRQYPNLPYRVIGGNLALVVALIAGIIIMVIPFLIQAGYLPQAVG